MKVTLATRQHQLIFILLLQSIITIEILPLRQHQHMNEKAPFDLTLVGFVDTTGIGGVPLPFIECLKRDVRINFLASKAFTSSMTLPPSTTTIIKSEDKTPGAVAIFTDIIQDKARNPYAAVPTASLIKIAYSMIEFDRLPPNWAPILNNHFDAVVIPDQWLIDVYQNSGVTIPIFVLPLALDLEPFFKRPIKGAPKKPFIFGNVGAFKNAEMLITAFTQAFGKSNDVKLRLHAQAFEPAVESLIQQKKAEGFSNLECEFNIFTKEKYIDYLSQFDCYVSLSRGEGFSIPTRQALALGIPVIISNHSAFKTICDTQYVRCVPANNLVATSPKLFNCPQSGCGHWFQCTVEDATAAFKDVYQNYKKHLNKARLARFWVEQYSYQNENIRKRYLNLVKPIKVILGDKNIITPHFLMTNSKPLFLKYQMLRSS